MSPEAALVAVILIGSWALVSFGAGALDLWTALADRSVMSDPTAAPHVPTLSLAVGLLMTVLWIYAYPAVVAGAVLGAVYLAVVHRAWLRCVAFAAGTLGGVVVATLMMYAGPNHSGDGDGTDRGWPLAFLGLVAGVLGLGWLLLGSDIRADRRARRAARMRDIHVTQG